MQKVKHRMATDREVRAPGQDGADLGWKTNVRLHPDVERIIFRDVGRNKVGSIIRVDGRVVLLGETLNHGPRITEIEYSK